jgi:tetratricopeptide (TPR) repeat protein
MTHESTKAVEVFYSYAHKDEKLREALEEHLSTLRRQGYISEWHDRQLVAGTDWAQEIDAHLHTATLILLLISPSFIASDYCYGIEMNLALERHQAGQARVIPIILRPTDLSDMPFAALQFLPAHGKAITTWQNRDEAFLNVARGIRTAIEDLTSSVDSTERPVQVKSQLLWNVPYQRNPLFTGRDEILKQLYEALRVGKTAALAQPQAISGLGGIGKTQTAVEYAYRYRDDYQTILWVKAETGESIISDFVTIAQLLNLPEKQEQDQLRIVEAVNRWFLEQSGWLLIFDNADDLAMVRDFLPPGGKGHILLTTRAHATGRIAQHIKVEKMKQAEGALFLLHRATILDPDAPLDDAMKSDRDTAKAIVQAMDGLPLALDQAGAYIEETNCGLQGYWQLYQTQGVELLKKRGDLVTDHPDPVATTWSLSFEIVDQANPAAAELLRFCAFLAPDAIPEELFTESAANLGPTLEPIASNLSTLNAAIKELLKYSLMQRDPEAQTLSIHRLVQEVLKDQMDSALQSIWVERIVKAVNATFPEVVFENWPLCERLLPHARACATLIEQWNLTLSEAAQLLNRVGCYVSERAFYREAEQHLQKALAIYKQVRGPEHPETADSLYNLATLYSKQGKYKQAEPFQQQALAIRERELGPERPETADSLNNLAFIYHSQGKYEQAEPLVVRALAIYKQVRGIEHLDTAYCLGNLGWLYMRQGKYEQAELVFQQALVIYEKTLGPEHPRTATGLNALAKLYQRQGKYDQAELLHKRALAIRERDLGPDHPETADSLKNLAWVYVDQEKHEQAEALLQRALAIHEQAPHLYLNLAWLYEQQGKYTQAEPLYQRALIEYSQAIELAPNNARYYFDRGWAYFQLEKYEEALVDYNRAIELSPDEAEYYKERGMTYSQLEKYEEASADYSRATDLAPDNAM